MERLKDRLDALWALAKSENTRPEVCEIMVGSVSADLQYLKHGTDLRLLQIRPTGNPEEESPVEKLRKQAGALLNKVEDQTRIGEDPLRKTVMWTRIAMAQRLAGSPAPHSSFQQELVEQWYHEASEAAEQLARNGLLTLGESLVIKADAAFRIQSNRYLVDDDPVGQLAELKHYSAQVSLNRLKDTLPPLSRVLREGNARPEYLEIIGRCAQMLRDDCLKVAEADGVALDDAERKQAANILPQARGMLAEIETALKEGTADKARRLAERAAAIDALAENDEISPAGMAAKAKTLEDEIDELKSQAGPVAPEVEHACRTAADVALWLDHRSRRISSTRPAQRDYDDLSDAWGALGNLDFYIRPSSEERTSSDYRMIADSKRPIRQAQVAMDQIERTGHLDRAEMDALRVATVHAAQPRDEESIADWPAALERLAKVEHPNPCVCDLVVRAVSVSLCRPYRRGDKEDADAKIYVRLNEIIARTPAGDTALDKTPQWKQVLFAWRFDAAMEKTLTINGSNPMTLYKLGVQSAEEHWYQQALPAIDALMDQKSLDKVEYVLLRAEAKYRIGQRHYLMDKHGNVTPVQPESVGCILARVAVNLPAFRRMVLLHKVRPVVRDMVTDTFRRDCWIIGDSAQVARLSEADQKEAAMVSKEANEILAQIDREAASQPASATKPGEPVEFDP
jgi:hypothetical protein